MNNMVSIEKITDMGLLTEFPRSQRPRWECI